ncbi:MAG: hypothetical protein ACFFHD_13660 [Promethearchaeota archaeon]
MKKTKKKKKKKNNSKLQKIEGKEYGVILTKDKNYRHRIYPQKGKAPEEDSDEYKIV